jgi:hypothetical protein
MKIAIMQPYFMPYIGYFQLINAVDKFVIYDDVNFITRGWINRNRILVHGKEHLFTIPLEKASQNKLINEISISTESWQRKLLNTVRLNYKKAPFLRNGFEIVRQQIELEETNLSKFIYTSIKTICDFLEIRTEIIPTSGIYGNQFLKAQSRIIDICIKEGAAQYINPIGGVDLYGREAFQRRNIQLFFLKTKPLVYNQFDNEFVGGLSIIDIIMFNHKDKIRQYLQEYELTG